MAHEVRRYHQSFPLLDDAGVIVKYVGDEVEVFNNTEGILSIAPSNPARFLEPLTHLTKRIPAGETCKLEAGLCDRLGVPIKENSDVLVIITDTSIPQLVFPMAGE